MNDNNTPEHVMNIMASMPVALIVDYMRANAITGYPGIGRSCPVTNIVRKLTGVEISTGLSTWARREGDVTSRDLPASVVRFIRSFDNDRYPDLIDPGYYEEFMGRLDGSHQAQARVE